ncbi:TPA: cell division protein SepF [Candidatus Galligastranaerophilus gallistercoris]|nr:cell division protein SepF [Candidatus Galligastranaerophilus gallistercoris]
MTSVSDKIRSIVGFLTSPFESGKEDDFFDGLQEEFETGYETDRNAALEPAFKQTSPIRNERKVISMPSRGYEHQKGYEVVVFEPRAYNESIQIAQALKERKTVILNLQLLDREESQRIVDFLCGCTHALDGNQRKIGDFVFIFTPNNINLTQEMVSSKLTRDALWNAPAPQAN